jgi:hypothetical protein
MHAPFAYANVRAPRRRDDTRGANAPDGPLQGAYRKNRHAPRGQRNDAHRDLDAAVAAGHGWPADTSEDEALIKLLKLKLSRAGTGTAEANSA